MTDSDKTVQPRDLDGRPLIIGGGPAGLTAALLHRMNKPLRDNIKPVPATVSLVKSDADNTGMVA